MKLLLPFLLFPLLLAVPTQDAQAQRTLECKSRNHDYRYCRADTNNSVRLEQRLSRARCVEGRSWGYDRHGIWVDDGCEARFSYGSRRHNDDNDDDVGAAVAVGAGLAVLLGAAAAASANDDHHRHRSHHDSRHHDSRRSDSRRSDSHRGNRPPSWMIGTFEDRNDRRKEMIVHSDGTIDMYWPRGVHARGEYRNGLVQMGNGDDLRIERERGGVWIINTRLSRDNPRNQNHYVRVR